MIYYLGEYERRTKIYEFYGYDDLTNEICYLLPRQFLDGDFADHYTHRDKVDRIKNIPYQCPAKRAYDLLIAAISKGKVIRKKSVEELENESELI